MLRKYSLKNIKVEEDMINLQRNGFGVVERYLS
jgi:hypothetical protein